MNTWSMSVRCSVTLGPSVGVTSILFSAVIYSASAGLRFCFSNFVFVFVADVVVEVRAVRLGRSKSTFDRQRHVVIDEQVTAVQKFHIQVTDVFPLRQAI